MGFCNFYELEFGAKKKGENLNWELHGVGPLLIKATRSKGGARSLPFLTDSLLKTFQVAINLHASFCFHLIHTRVIAKRMLGSRLSVENIASFTNFSSQKRGRS